MIGCDCEVCTSTDPRDTRLRTSAVVHAPEGDILIDAGPELRLQAIRYKLRRIESLLLTHAHADHIFGLDDTRRFCDALQGPLPCYMNAPCRERLEKIFGYCLRPPADVQKFYPYPHLLFHEVAGPFETAGVRVTPVPLMHGALEVLGFKFGGLAYCTDVKTIPESSVPLLEGLEVLVLDALRPTPHNTHMSLGEALETVRRLKPRRTYFVHMAHAIGHAKVSRELPPGVELAYDGQVIEWGG
jgi:phosphoribosyl 1,2-cyclic phosphate phosphodiesterase